MLVIDRSDSRHFLLLVLGEALLKRVFPGVLAAAGVLLELGLAGGREEGLLADVADDVHGLLVALELRSGLGGSILCVAGTLLRGLGSVTSTHFVGLGFLYG